MENVLKTDYTKGVTGFGALLYSQREIIGVRIVVKNEDNVEFFDIATTKIPLPKTYLASVVGSKMSLRHKDGFAISEWELKNKVLIPHYSDDETAVDIAYVELAKYIIRTYKGDGLALEELEKATKEYKPHLYDKIYTVKKVEEKPKAETKSKTTEESKPKAKKVAKEKEDADGKKSVKSAEPKKKAEAKKETKTTTKTKKSEGEKVVKEKAVKEKKEKTTKAKKDASEKKATGTKKATKTKKEK